MIRVGVGGWTFAPWRGVFYPEGLPQKRELEYASRHLTCIEINGTFYGAQKPESFARWHDETPDGFVFTLKGPRFATHRRRLEEGGRSVEGFVTGGPLELKDKLGPINWQLPPFKKFDPAEFAAFLALLPASHEGRALRHAVEVRHDSFLAAEATELAREHGVALVLAGDSKYPEVAEPTAPFVYARIMGTSAGQSNGYADADLDRWAARARSWAAGGRDVYLHVINGCKERNPAAAMALIERLGPPA